MTPRGRTPANALLKKTPNLYRNGASFVYRNPITGKRTGMGSDLARATAAAKKLNDILTRETDLVAKALGENTFGQWLDRYEREYLPTKGLKPGTLTIQAYRIARLNKDLGGKTMGDLTVAVLSDYLDTNHQRDAYVKHRGLLVDVFRFAMSKGAMETNPAESTLAKNRVEKKRKPLSLKQYQAIHAVAPHWLQVAMDMALVTLQRRGDLLKMTYDDVRDNRLYVVQEKTEKHGVRARLSINMTSDLYELFSRSRKDGVHTQFVIHERPQRVKASANKTHWAQVLPDRLTKQFAKYRDETGLFDKIPAEQRPTFHEIRALGGFLYLEQGYPKEYVNLLMGHTTMGMTEHYTDRHVEYTECSADLDLHKIL